MKPNKTPIDFLLKDGMIVLSSKNEKVFKYDVCHKHGYILRQGAFRNYTKVDVSDLKKGLYEIVIFAEEFLFRMCFSMN